MVLVLVSWARGRGRGGTTTGVGPRLARLGFARADFGVVGRLLGFLACLGPGFSGRCRLGQGGQPLVATGDGIGDTQALGPLRLLGLLGEGEQRVDLRAPWALECEQTLVTERTALGGIGVDCGAVQTEVAQGQHPQYLGLQEDGHQEVLQCS